MPTYRLLLAHDADEIVDFEVGGPPPAVTRYSVVLRHLDPAGNATAVRVYDNSHTPRRASHAQVRSTRAATAAAITTGSQRSQSSTPAVSGSPPMRTNMPPASSDSSPSGPATTTRSSQSSPSARLTCAPVRTVIRSWASMRSTRHRSGERFAPHEHRHVL